MSKGRRLFLQSFSKEYLPFLPPKGKNYFLVFFLKDYHSLQTQKAGILRKLLQKITSNRGKISPQIIETSLLLLCKYAIIILRCTYGIL